MPRVALLSLHSHADRSFLVDDELSRVGAALRARGVPCRAVEAVVEPGGRDGAALAELSSALAAFETVVFGRYFDPNVVQALRAALPGRRFLLCAGEHPVREPPADEVIAPGALVEALAGAGGPPAAEEPALRLGAAARRARALVLRGASGCPYQADARENPLYAGVSIPARHGRGCAFCATGNHHEPRPAGELIASLRAQARELLGVAGSDRRFVLKDQNPFVYLEELVRGLAADGSAPLTLLLETRADWFLRGRRRVEGALATARGTGIVLAPYLVGIESFSQPELDRFNKGIRAETNVEFLGAVRALAGAHPESFTLAHAAFGFVLFTPWTTLDDLRVNHARVVETRFYELRGRLLLSRARLYEDNALYYLAARDGLLAERFEDPRDDPSARFGYLPSHPWRFLHAETARFARAATDLADRLPPSEEPALFAALLDAVDAAGGALELDEAQVLARLEARSRRGPRAARAPIVCVHASGCPPRKLPRGGQEGLRSDEGFPRTAAECTQVLEQRTAGNPQSARQISRRPHQWRERVPPIVVGGDEGPRSTVELLVGDARAALAAAIGSAPGAPLVLELPPHLAAEVLGDPALAGRELVVDVPPPLEALPDHPRASVGLRWVSRRGWQRLIAAAERERLGSGEVELRGVPGVVAPSLERLVWEALALARSIVTEVRLAGAERDPAGGARLTLAGPKGERLVLTVAPRGEPRARARLQLGGVEVRWSADTRERLEWRSSAGAPRVAEVPPGDSDARSLARPRRGRSATDALAIAPLARAALEALAPRAAPAPRQLRLAERLAARAPGSLAQLGLAGELPAGPPTRVVPAPELGRVELAALRAGLKPAAFLTARREEVAALRAELGGWHVEERTRRVLVTGHDRWVDRRDEGDPRVELYVARTPEAAAELARLQADEDPSQRAGGLGRLLGYPACCVEAFVAQDSRDDNTRNRYLVEARTPATAPCPWTLNGFELALSPFFPCRWDCAEARRWAAEAWRAIARERRDAAEVEAFLRRPVLYFAHGALLRFEGDAARDDRGWTVRYAGVSLPPGTPTALARLASAVALGDRLVLGDDSLTVFAGDRQSFVLRRREPLLGLGRGFGEG